MKKRKVISLIFLFLSALLYAENSPNLFKVGDLQCVILDKEKMESSKKNYREDEITILHAINVDDLWTPTKEQAERAVGILEQTLKDLKNVQFRELSFYRCQAFGVKSKNKKLIYLNVIPPPKQPSKERPLEYAFDWTQRPDLIVEGGAPWCFFQSLYIDDKIVFLHVNNIGDKQEKVLVYKLSK